MIYGVFTDGKDYFGGVYSTYEQWYADTFSPDAEVLGMFELKVHGKTYAEKKACLQNQAHIFDDTSYLIDLSYGELYDLGRYFQRNGKRYGLIKEFTENFIC